MVWLEGRGREGGGDVGVSYGIATVPMIHDQNTKGSRYPRLNSRSAG